MATVLLQPSIVTWQNHYSQDGLYEIINYGTNFIVSAEDSLEPSSEAILMTWLPNIEDISWLSTVKDFYAHSHS